MTRRSTCLFNHQRAGGGARPAITAAGKGDGEPGKHEGLGRIRVRGTGVEPRAHTRPQTVFAVWGFLLPRQPREVAYAPKDDGRAGVAVQTPGLYLPRLGYLRGPSGDLRLRPA